MQFFSNTQYWIRHLAQRHRSSVTEHRTSSYLQPKIYLWSNDLKGPYSQSVLPFRWNMNVIWMSYSFDWPDNRQQTHVTNCINPSPSGYDMTKILRSLIEAKTTFMVGCGLWTNDYLIFVGCAHACTMTRLSPFTTHNKKLYLYCCVVVLRCRPKVLSQFKNVDKKKTETFSRSSVDIPRDPYLYIHLVLDDVWHMATVKGA